MRTTTIQLLINKTPQFSQSLSKIQEKEMILIFSPLLIESLTILKGILSQLSNKTNNDKQDFVMALFSLLQRTSSNLLPSELKEKIMSVVLNFGQHASTFSMMLHA